MVGYDYNEFGLSLLRTSYNYALSRPSIKKKRKKFT